MARLEGNVAVMTGGSSGIALALASSSSSWALRTAAPAGLNSVTRSFSPSRTEPLTLRACLLTRRRWLVVSG